MFSNLHPPNNSLRRPKPHLMEIMRRFIEVRWGLGYTFSWLFITAARGPYHVLAHLGLKDPLIRGPCIIISAPQAIMAVHACRQSCVPGCCMAAKLVTASSYSTASVAPQVLNGLNSEPRNCETPERTPPTPDPSYKNVSRPQPSCLARIPRGFLGLGGVLHVPEPLVLALCVRHFLSRLAQCISNTS